MPRPFLKRSSRPARPPPMLRGVTALVSGGGSGLGAAVSRRIVEGGGRVLISDVNEAAGAGLAGALGPSAVFARTDCTSASEVEQARRSPRSMARRGRWRMLRQRARSWA